MKSKTVTIVNESIHARPATRLVQMAKKYESDITLQKGDKEHNFKSMVALIALSLSKGDEVIVKAIGPDEDTAVKELVAFMESGCGEE